MPPYQYMHLPSLTEDAQVLQTLTENNYALAEL
jgi:hypothetical protein